MYLLKPTSPDSLKLVWKIPWMEEPGRLQSPSAVILEPPKIKSDTVSHEVMGPDAMIFVL